MPRYFKERFELLALCAGPLFPAYLDTGGCKPSINKQAAYTTQGTWFPSPCLMASIAFVVSLNKPEAFSPSF